MAEQDRYKHNFCLSFSVMSNQAPDAVSVMEMRKEIARVLKQDDEGMLFSVRLEDTEDLRPTKGSSRSVKAVLRLEKGEGEAQYVGRIDGVGNVRVFMRDGKMQGSVSNLDKQGESDTDRC